MTHSSGATVSHLCSLRRGAKICAGLCVSCLSGSSDIIIRRQSEQGWLIDGTLLSSCTSSLNKADNKTKRVKEVRMVVWYQACKLKMWPVIRHRTKSKYNKLNSHYTSVLRIGRTLEPCVTTLRPTITIAALDKFYLPAMGKHRNRT